VHQDIGTGLQGAVRFSLGPFTSQDDIQAAVSAMEQIAGLA
jgi:cysteine sulfinate desulfinase/cysteine desulfurase-like protein